MNILFALLLLNFACKKADVKSSNSINLVRPADTSRVTSPPTLPVDSARIPPRDSVVTLPPSTLPPVVFAGADQTIVLPLNYISLSGSYTTQNEFKGASWKRISGPSCYIQNTNALATKVIELLEGTYRFELTVFDKWNLSGKDTVSVIVKPNVTVGTNFVIFNSLNWVFPWYNSIEVKDIYSFIPHEKPIKVFVQRGDSDSWIEVPPLSSDPNNHKYEYFIETRWPDGAGMYTFGSLYIFYYGSDTNDHPKVKVEF